MILSPLFLGVNGMNKASYYQARGIRDLSGDVEKKFWSKVEKLGEDECWPWTGLTNNGYGVLKQRYGPRALNKAFEVQAHRVSYELHYELLEAGEIVRHSCHYTICVNPHHLKKGSHEDNMQDMVRSGRSTSGIRNPRALLGFDDVNYIRRMRREGVSLRKLAEELGVHLATIDMAARGGSWGEQVIEPPVEKKLRRISDSELEEMYSKWKSGASFKNLSDEYGFCASTISSRVKRLHKERE